MHSGQGELSTNQRSRRQSEEGYRPIRAVGSILSDKAYTFQGIKVLSFIDCMISNDPFKDKIY